jgi:hypothetical protein
MKKKQKQSPTRSFHYPKIIENQLTLLQKATGESMSAVIKRAITEMFNRLSKGK